MKKQIFSIIQITLILFVFILTNSCKNNSNTTSTSVSVKDVDSNVYETITIGTQTWMQKNLKVTHYRNGDTIPNVTESKEWISLTTGAYCNYNNDTNNAITNGSLYNYYAIVDSRNLCPTGWHMPMDAEWSTLITYLGGETIAGNKLKEAGNSHWKYNNKTAANESGFTAIPGGERSGIAGSFAYLGNHGIWWSLTGDARLIEMSDFSCEVLKADANKKEGHSVRCIKD